MRLSPALALPALLLGCRPHLRIEVTRPADVLIRSDVQTLAVIDRVDREGTRAAVADFIDGMLRLKSARFDIVDRQSSRALYASVGATEGMPLTRAQSKQLCEQTRSTGIVTLDSMDSSGDWIFSQRIEQQTTTETVTTNGRSVTRDVTRDVTVHEATYVATADVTWRLYPCGEPPLDIVTIHIEDSWYGEGDSPTEARTNAGDVEAMLDNLVAATGVSYLHRVSPHEEVLSRPYYRGLGGNLRAGSTYLANGKLDRAEETYKDGLQGAGDRKKGKLLYDMALVSEQQGDMDEALKRAKRADRLLDNRLSDQLLRDLRARRREQSTVAQQLSPEPE